jgi:PAS domain S-box-containing protein
MTDPAGRTVVSQYSTGDKSSLLNGLSGEQAEVVRRFLDERDTLMLLHGSLAEVERAETLEERLQVFVQAIQRMGFARVVLTTRNDSLDAVLVVSAGLTEGEHIELRDRPASGSVWRRRLENLEPFRVSQSYYLDGRDPRIREAFRGGLPSTLRPSEDPLWTPHDALLVLLRSREGRLNATLILDDPIDRRRPPISRIRIVELFAQQIAYTIEQARLVSLAERRAERLQRLQEVGSTLARLMDAREIWEELGRQVLRVIPGDGLVVASPDLENEVLRSRYHIVRNKEQPPTELPLGNGIIGVVARTGRPILANDYDSVRATGAPDLLDIGGACRSALAVPLRIGARLLGVLVARSSAEGTFSQEDEELLVIIASQASTALANAELYAESERERRQSEALADVARAVNESLRIGEVMHLILRHATALLRAEGATLSMREGDQLHVVAAVGSAAHIAGMHLPVNASLSGRVLRLAEAAIVNDVPSEPDVFRPTVRMANVSRAVVVPLITKDGAVGVLTVVNRESEFHDDDLRVLQRLADHVAVAVVNARLFEEVAEATREWRVAFDAIPHGMVVTDGEGRIARCNVAAVRMAQLPRAESLVGRDFHEAILGVTAAEANDSPVPRALRGATGRGLCRSVSRDRMFEIVASPHPGGGAVVTFEDVTNVQALKERHVRVIETAADAIVITDLERRIAFANPAAHELLGRGAELVGMPVSAFLPPESQEEVYEHQRLGFIGHGQQYETTILRTDGDRRRVAIRTAPLRELGRVTGIVASLHDVTDERRARDALAQSEARYRNLFEIATDAIYTVDARGFFTSANDATCRLADTQRESLLGRSITPFIQQDDKREVAEHFRAALNGESRRFECRMITPAGSVRQLSVTNTPIRHGSKVVGVLGVARDVTDERERALALERSEASYVNLVESASDGIFTVDEEGRLTSVNKALERTTGYTRVELVGQHFSSLLPAEDRNEMWMVFSATLRGERTRADIRYMDRDGVARYGAITTAPIVEGGRVTGGLGVVRDVTDEKMLLEQLIQQEKLAAIGQLVSGVAHELNNPLAGVMAFAQLLLASPAIKDDQRAAVETIHQEAKRAARIVNNLLTFARQHPPERTVTDINKVVSDTLELRRYALERDGVEVVEELSPDLPLTWADPFQLQQVFLNLVTNAEHAVSDSNRRRIEVSTSVEGGCIVASVSDTGKGIPGEQVDRIFNPFFTTKPVGQGTGLGLSISDGIVKEHGGRIRVESEAGCGATFRVELPLTLPPRRSSRQDIHALSGAPDENGDG